MRLLYLTIIFIGVLSASIVGTTKGEFSVNQGAANYKIKIDTPPGIAGMEPELSINYNSLNNKDGYLGKGWNISGLSIITRCPQSQVVDGKSYVHGVNYDTRDKFCLDGKRLINISGRYGADGTEYRTEINNYSKIISHQQYKSSHMPSWFEVKTKSGLTYKYGKNSDSYLENKGSKAFWRLNEIEDTFGNKIKYHYIKNSYSLGDGTHRENYINYITYANNKIEFNYEDKRLKRDLYSGGEVNSITKRLKEIVVKSGSSVVRRYKFKYSNNEINIPEDKLVSITETTTDGNLKTLYIYWNNGNASFSQKDMNLPWSSVPVNKNASSKVIDDKGVQFADLNGDGLLDIIQLYIGKNGEDHRAVYLNNGKQFIRSEQFSSHLPNAYFSNYKGESLGTRLADINGDGLVDIIQMYLANDSHGYYGNRPQRHVWINTGKGFRSSGWYTSSNLPDTYFAEKNGWDMGTRLADINGDGLVDIIQMYMPKNRHNANYGGIPQRRVYINSGTSRGFVKSSYYSSYLPDAYFSGENGQDMGTRLADINGDGLVDIIQMYLPNKYYNRKAQRHVWINTGKRFRLSSYYTSSNLPDAYFTGADGQDMGTRLADINSDGLVDIIQMYIPNRTYYGGKAQRRVYINSGGKRGFIKSAIYSNTLPDTYFTGANGQDMGTRLADINGDGLVDIIQMYIPRDRYNAYYGGTAQRRIFLNGGSSRGFIKDTYFSKTLPDTYFTGKDGVSLGTRLADVNGDGLLDIVQLYTPENDYYSWIQQRRVYINNYSKKRVTRFNNRVDQDIKIIYKNMTDKAIYSMLPANTRAYNSIKNDNIPVALTTPLVYRVYSLNGVGGYNSKSYMYSDYIINKLRGPQGFRYIVTYDETPRAGGVKYASGVIYKQIEKPNGVGFEFTGMPYYSYSGRKYKNRTSSNPWANLDRWGKWLLAERVEYKNASKNSKIYEPYTYLNTKYTYDPRSKKIIKKEYNYNYVSRDGHGNVYKKVNKIYDVINKKSFYTTTYNYYHDNSNKWYLGRLVKSKVYHSQTGSKTIVKESQFAYNSKGILSKEVFNANSSLKLTKTYNYDSHGNKVKECINGYGVNRCSYNKYDSLGKFKVYSVDAAGLKTTYKYDARFGTPIKITDANGLSTYIKYDGLGRKIEEKNSLGEFVSWHHVWGSNYIKAKNSIYSVAISSSGKPFVRKYYDIFGREVGEYSYTIYTPSKSSLTSRRVLSRKYYNKLGELYKEELPHYQSYNNYGTITTTYDQYGRAIKVVKLGADGKYKTYRASYTNFTKIETNPIGAKRVTYKNAKGQTIKIVDAYGTTKASIVTYKYDSFGNLIQTTNPKGNTIYTKYDIAGNKIYMKDPDLGVWNYRYYADGNLRVKWSGESGYSGSKNSSYYVYDRVGRLIRTNTYSRVEYNKNHREYSYNFKIFHYGDAKSYIGYRGKLKWSYASSKLKGKDWQGQFVWNDYDKYGRLINSSRYIYSANRWFDTKTTYDEYNRVSSISYPNGYKVYNHYNSGILYYIKGSDGKVHYRVNDYDAFGNIRYALYANGVISNTYTNKAGVVEYMYDYKPSITNGAIKDLSYSYDRVGNISKREDRSIDKKYIIDSYRYDVLNRLTTLNVSSNIKGDYKKRKTYQYDKAGNITYKSDVGYYRYNSLHPHAVVKAGSGIYRYDHMGNMIYRDGDIISYYPNAKVAKIVGKGGNELSYYYGDDNSRYLKKERNQDTYYIGKLYEEQEDNTNNIKEIAYIYFGGKLVGTHIQKYTKGIGSKDITNNYFHTDTLGSITAITDSSGKVIERRSYEPFGSIRKLDYGLKTKDTLLESLRAFTGHEHIKGFNNLINMNARLYDSKLGRFISADSIIQYPYHSQGLNRYSYIENNPLMAPDPTGHGFFSWIGSLFKSIFNSFKTIISVVVTAVIVVYMPEALASLGGIWVTNGAASMSAMMLSGAVAGFSSAFIATGSLNTALTAGLWGAIGAGVANFIGHSAMFANVSKFGKAIAHGLSRAAISAIQGGKALGGFLSGFAGKILGGIAAGMDNISTTTRTILMSVAGGTASVLGGGKFGNGALSSAFIFMFNDNQDPRLNGRGVPRALGGDGRGNEEDLKRAEAFEEESRLGTIRGLKNTRTLSTFGAYGSAASGQLEGVAFFTITRLASDWGISALNGQDNMAIYRHGIIDLGTSFYPNPSIAPAGMIIRIYLKKEGDNYATSY